MASCKASISVYAFESMAAKYALRTTPTNSPLSGIGSLNRR